MKRKLSAATVMLTMALVVSGCTASQPAPGQSVTDTAGPINYWYSGSQEGTLPLINLWNKLHPDMPVTGTNPGVGAEYEAKLSAANQAGNPPDVANLQYQFIPSFVASGVLDDASKYFNKYKNEYSPSGWASVSFNNVVYALPRDATPMLFYYRTDLFEKYGLTVPKTWDEFATSAAKLKSAEPTKYLSNFPPNAAAAGWFVSLAGQAGSQWWSTKDNKWKIGIADDPGKKVAKYWGDLVGRDLVNALKESTPEWNAAIASGQLVSVIGAPGTLPIIKSAGPDTSGLWAVAPIPQWEAGQASVPYNGGTALVSPAKAKNKSGAAEFIHWMTSDPVALTSRVNTNTAFPAIVDPLGKLDVLKLPPAFMSKQADFWDIVNAANKTGVTISWGPNTPAAYLDYESAFGTAAKNHTSFVDALQKVNDAVVADMKRSGFPLVDGTQ